jgi:kinesin family member 1
MARSESFIVSNDDRKLREPHLLNLNEDQLLSGVVFHFLSQSTPVTVGRKDAKTPPVISLSGLRSVTNHHSTS